MFRTGATPFQVLGNTFTATGSTNATPGEGTGIFVTDDKTVLGESTTNNDANVVIRGNTISGYFRGVHVQAVDGNAPAETLTVTVGGPLASQDTLVGAGVRTRASSSRTTPTPAARS